MIQVFADDALAYDSRLSKYDLIGLEATTGLNIGGTAKIVMPIRHPAYGLFTAYKTVVEICRDGNIRFRGRPLYSADTFYGQRTVTCEGELGFLRDSIVRPASLKGLPADIFRSLIQAHNEQTDPAKRFTVGEIDVESEEITLDIEAAETVLSAVNKLLDLCSGYITFSGAYGEDRSINWLSVLNAKSTQTIEFGNNLLAFSSTGANTKKLATGIVPYGAKDEKTGERITIASVNNGFDYIIATDAQAIRGTIMTTITYDDVADPAVLLERAKADLDEAKAYITSLELSALDLSYQDKSIDSFTTGDLCRVLAPPYGLDDDFQLSQLTENFLNPAKSRGTWGRTVQSLTGADVFTENSRRKESDAMKAQVQAAAQAGAKQAAILLGESFTKKAETRTNFAEDPSHVKARVGSVSFSPGVLLIDGADILGAEAIPDAYMSLLDNLEPIRFKCSADGSTRYHVGFSAKALLSAMSAAGLDQNDFGGYTDANGTGAYIGLAYYEFIGLLLEKLRRLEEKIKVLEG